MAAAQPGEAWTPSSVQQQRSAYRRRQALQRGSIAAASTIAVLVLLVVVTVSSPGWDRVRAAYFDVDYAKSVFPDLAKAFWLNVKLFVVSEILILIVGLVIAVVRVVPSP